MNREERDAVDIFAKGATIYTNVQIRESIKQLAVSTDELTRHFRELNVEMGKANAYFERMDRSSQTLERLTEILTVLTAMLFLLGSYSFFLDWGADRNVSLFVSAILTVIIVAYVERTKIINGLFRRLEGSKK